jgi:hypothetical protein
MPERQMPESSRPAKYQDKIENQNQSPANRRNHGRGVAGHERRGKPERPRGAENQSRTEGGIRGGRTLFRKGAEGDPHRLMMDDDVRRVRIRRARIDSYLGASFFRG